MGRQNDSGSKSVKNRLGKGDRDSKMLQGFAWPPEL